MFMIASFISKSDGHLSVRHNLIQSVPTEVERLFEHCNFVTPNLKFESVINLIGNTKESFSTNCLQFEMVQTH